MRYNLLFFSFLCFFISFAQADFYPDRILLKVKEEYRDLCSDHGISHPEIQQINQGLQNSKLFKLFPNHFPPRVKFKNGLPLADLSLNYQWTFNPTMQPEKLVEQLIKLNLFEYVEVEYIMYPLATSFTPNDPNITDQWHLPLMELFDAWGIEQGDTNVVIGITDTGVELNHPDLVNNIKYNYADPINGIDDDGDGYVDNFYGWNTGDNNNNTEFSNSNHGVTVAGMAAATTHNNNQIAGTGFRVKFLPVKIMNSSGQLTGAYSGIVYAADNNCSVINASWGSPNSFNQTAQDIINYATINKDALVVCSAGNSNKEDKFYPASYQWALSVAGTDQNDVKWFSNTEFGTNYNYLVDVTAPSVGVFGITSGGNTIGGRNGTSISAPLVAGVAGLIKSSLPSLTAIQIGEQLKSSADFIDSIPGNSNFIDKLGHGRVNANRALSDYSKPGLHFINAKTSDFNDDWYVTGDTLRIWGTVVNFLNTTSGNAFAKVKSDSPYLKNLNVETPITGIGPYQQISTQVIPFLFIIEDGVPNNHQAEIVVEMIDGNYKAKSILTVILNTDYLSFKYNDFATTITSNGKIGFNDGGSNQQGIGVRLNNQNNILYQAGILFGNANDKMSFALLNELSSSQNIQLYNPGIISDAEVQNTLNDAPSATPLGVTIKQQSLAWNEPNLNQSILLKYTIYNPNQTSITDFHFGIYADWDIVNANQNLADYDSLHQLAYTHYNQQSFAGIHLINTNNINHYAFENSGTNGSININQGFSKTNQFYSISNGNTRAKVTTPTDVSHTLAAGPYTITAGDSITIAFALIAGNNLPELQKQSLSIDSVYNSKHQINLHSNIQGVSCADSCNAIITFSITNGVNKYALYLVNDSIITDTLINVCPGNYSFTVVDIIGNRDTINLTIDTPLPINNMFSNIIADHENCSGAATANPSGGVLPYTIKWVPSTSNSLTAENLCSGKHYLNITDSLGCVAKDSLYIDLITNSLSPKPTKINLHPNPAQEFVKIQFQKDTYALVKIYNPQGKLCYLDNQYISGKNIPLNNYIPGVYLINIQFSDEVFSDKLIIQ